MNAIKHWRWQRYSALLALFLLPWLIWELSTMYHAGGFSSETIIAWFNPPIKGLLLLVTFSVSLFHAKLGLEVIIEDYIPKVNQQNVWIKVCSVIIIICWLLLTFAIISNISF